VDGGAAVVIAEVLRDQGQGRGAREGWQSGR
jgi:hypothetical protein